MSRIILKISGEALKDENELVSEKKLEIVKKTVEMLQPNHQIAIVVGGGNYFRGRENPQIDKVTGDTIGMLGTVINALYLKDYLLRSNIPSCVSTPFGFPNLLENYSDQELLERFLQGSIVIFGGGIGQSGFSSDSGTILACEKLAIDLIIKMTNVDGVYNDDPKQNSQAKMFSQLSFAEIISNKYHVMDEYALKKCAEKNIKILVVNFLKYQEVANYFKGSFLGTEIGGD